MSEPELIEFGQGLAARVAPGPGEKVLWIHGYTIDSTVWGDLWRQLPAWYHIGMDLPGHGASVPLSNFPSLAMLGQTIGRLALEHGVRHIIALSFGTLIALQVAIEFPDAFASLILGAPTMGAGPQDPFARIRYREMLELYWQKGLGPHMTELWMRFPPDLFKGAAHRPALWRQLQTLVNRHTWAELRDPVMRGFSAHPQTPADLRQITAATLIMVGDEEMPAFKYSAELIRRDIPTAEVVFLPQTGHLCMLEEPVLSGEKIASHLQKHKA
ncbi:MAG: alpha/beta hydrolase [Anaerolineales bacterium]|nr:alpha/beta hydrolase [Anaerolineales bacterium]MCB8953040.1 alpha/beta hydrolase [Ardenticatenales bacterium]